MTIYSHVTHIGVLERFTNNLNLSIKHCEIYNTNRINVNPYKITLSTIVRKIMMIMIITILMMIIIIIIKNKTIILIKTIINDEINGSN